MDVEVTALDPRAARYLATRPTGDPLVVANRLIDHATKLQTVGRYEEADDLLVEANRLLEPLAS